MVVGEFWGDGGVFLEGVGEVVGGEGGVEGSLGAEGVEDPIALCGLADEGLAAAEDGSDGGVLGDDFEVGAAEFFGEFGEFLACGGGGVFVEFAPFVGGTDAEGLVADGDEPAASADADVGFIPRGAEGEDFPFGAAVGAELVVEESVGALAEDAIWVGGGGGVFGGLEISERGEMGGGEAHEGGGVESAAALENDCGVPAGRWGGDVIDEGGNLWVGDFGGNFLPLGLGCSEADDGEGVPDFFSGDGFDVLVEGDGVREEGFDEPAWLEVFSGDGVDHAGGDAGGSGVAAIFHFKRDFPVMKFPCEAGAGEALADDEPGGHGLRGLGLERLRQRDSMGPMGWDRSQKLVAAIWMAKMARVRRSPLTALIFP